MEVLAGVIIGIIVTISYLKKPITININKTIEEIKPPVVPMATMEESLNKTDPKEDKVYEEDMTSMLEEVNKMMLGGGTSGKAK